MNLEKVKTITNLFREKEKDPRCSAVIVAAGSSERMGNDKLTADLGGIPVLARTLRAFEACPLIAEIIVVTRADRIEEMADLCRSFEISKVSKVLAGGATRVESALVGVSEADPRLNLIAIHDGARPLVSQELIERSVRAAKEHYAAVPIIPSTDTLKIVDAKGFVAGTVDRASTFRVQTPQVFKAEFIKGALTRAMEKELPLTDDCSAVEMMGVKTVTVPGDEDNIKLTTPRDMILAEAILKAREA